MRKGFELGICLICLMVGPQAGPVCVVPQPALLVSPACWPGAS